MVGVWSSATSAVPARNTSQTFPSLVDLRTLPDESAIFTLYLPIDAWRDQLPPFLRNSETPQSTIRDAARPYLDPRAESFLSPLILQRASAFALSVWPDVEVGGDSRPVWMMGFDFDTSTDADRIREKLQNDLASGRTYSPINRLIGGVRVFTIETSSKDLHFASPDKTLLVSSNLAALQSYLAVHARDLLPVPPVSPSTVITWRTRSSEIHSKTPLSSMNRLLWNFGVRTVQCELGPSETGYLLRLVFEGELGLKSQGREMEFDYDLIDQVPQDADFILMGGGLPSENVYFSAEFPSLPALSPGVGSGGFAVGVAIPDGTQTQGVASRIAGAYKKSPDPIPREALSESDVEVNAKSLNPLGDRMEIGDLGLAFFEREGEVVFRNTSDLTPPPSIGDKLRSMIENRNDVPRPSYVALLSPRLLIRPIDLEWERIQRTDPKSPFIALWPLIRPLFSPVQLLIFSNHPDSIEIELESPSLISALTLIPEFANFLAFLERDDRSLLHQWFGEFGPLPGE